MWYRFLCAVVSRCDSSRSQGIKLFTFNLVETSRYIAFAHLFSPSFFFFFIANRHLSHPETIFFFSLSLSLSLFSKTRSNFSKKRLKISNDSTEWNLSIRYRDIFLRFFNRENFKWYYSSRCLNVVKRRFINLWLD